MSTDIKDVKDVKISSKKQKREYKENRRRHPEISKQIILLWEELRQRVVKPERKLELCDQILKASKMFLLELIKQKTTARVFESVIEFGSEEQRWSIFEIVKPELLLLCKGKYSYFVVNNMLKHGTKEQRLAVFSSMKGNIVDLLKHSYASKVVEVAYDEVATSCQRREMVQEFYGKTFVLFKGEKEVNHLSEITTTTAYDLSIIKNLHAVVIQILTKALTDLSIVQRVLLEYFEVLVAANEKQATAGGVNHYGPYVDEVVELIQNQLLKLCNTREGSKLAMLIYWHCNAKSRKKILTEAKEVINNLCLSENSHLFVITLLDQTDDIKVLEKSIIKPIMSNLDAIAASLHGRKVLQFILNHRDKKFFNSITLNLIGKGDGNPHSKKDSLVRASEVLEASKKPLLAWLANNIDHCLNYSTYMNLATSIIAKCIPSGDEMANQYKAVLKRVAESIDEAMVPVSVGNKRKAKTETKQLPKKKAKNFAGVFEGEEAAEEALVDEEVDKIDTHILEASAGQVLTRVIFSLEKERKIEGFSSLVTECLSVENMRTFVTCNRAAFFLVNLFETGDDSVKAFVKENLKGAEKTMAKSGLQGVKILCKHLF